MSTYNTYKITTISEEKCAESIKPLWKQNIIDIITQYYPKDTDPILIEEFVDELPELYDSINKSHIHYIMEEINNNIPKTQLNKINELLVDAINERELNREYHYVLHDITNILLGQNNWKQDASYITNMDDNIISKNKMRFRLEMAQREITKQLNIINHS
jgi:hypothetical protein